MFQIHNIIYKCCKISVFDIEFVCSSRSENVWGSKI